MGLCIAIFLTRVVFDPPKGNWWADAAVLCRNLQGGSVLRPPRPLLCSQTDSVSVWKYCRQKPRGIVCHNRSTTWINRVRLYRTFEKYYCKAFHGINNLLKLLIFVLLQEMDSWYRSKFEDLNGASSKHAHETRSLREEIAGYKKDVSMISCSCSFPTHS